MSDSHILESANIYGTVSACGKVLGSQTYKTQVTQECAAQLENLTSSDLLPGIIYILLIDRHKHIGLYNLLERAFEGIVGGNKKRLSGHSFQSLILFYY